MLLAALLLGCGGSAAGPDADQTDAPRADGGADAASPDAAPGDGPPPDAVSTYTVGGEVRCLRGAGVVLENEGEALAISESGTFQFTTTFGDGADYEVTVSVDPADPAQQCIVRGGVGTIAGSSVTDVVVSCSGEPATRVAYYTHDPVDGGHVWLSTLDASGCPAADPVVVGPPDSLTLWQVEFAMGGARLLFDGDPSGDLVFNATLDVVDVSSPDLATSVLGGPNHVNRVVLSPDSTRVLYTERSADSTYHVFLVDLGAWPPTTQPVSGPFGFVRFPEWSLDSSAVLLNPATGTPEVYRAYLIDLDDASPYAVEISGALEYNRDVEEIAIAPDATRAAYVADHEVDNTYELYLVDLSASTPGDPLKVSPAVPAFSRVLDPVFTPDGDGLVFRLRHQGVTDLFLIDLTGPGIGSPVRLNEPLAVGSEITSSAISPDSRWVAYWGDQDLPGAPELFIVDISGATPGAPVRISPEGADSTGSSVPVPARFTSDGRWIVFRADDWSKGGPYSAFAVDISAASPSAAYPVSPPLGLGESVGFVQVAPDGSRVLCTYGTQDGPGRIAVADLSGATPGPAIEIPFEGSLEINPVQPAFTADGGAVLFTARTPGEPSVVELLVAHVATEVVDPVQRVHFASAWSGAFDTTPLP